MLVKNVRAENRGEEVRRIAKRSIEGSINQALKWVRSEFKVLIKGLTEMVRIDWCSMFRGEQINRGFRARWSSLANSTCWMNLEEFKRVVLRKGMAWKAHGQNLIICT